VTTGQLKANHPRSTPWPEPGPSIPSPEEFAAKHSYSGVSRPGSGYWVVVGGLGGVVVFVGALFLPEFTIPAIGTWSVQHAGG
jgi:hypothetical protein